jgi:uncharacterized protein (TIGR03437 family)
MVSANAASSFSAIFGGLGQDYVSAVTSDGQGDVYVAGLTYSSDFPVTPGNAGVYQVTIQIPAAAPLGAVALQASVGGAQTAPGVTIFVGQ